MRWDKHAPAPLGFKIICDRTDEYSFDDLSSDCHDALCRIGVRIYALVEQRDTSAYLAAC